MSAFFLKKRTRRAFGPGLSSSSAPSAGTSTPPAKPARPARPPPQPPASAAAGPSSAPSAASSSDVKAEPANNDHIVEIQIVSADPGAGLRYNLMKMNSTRDVDPSHIPAPILMNRKQPGPKQPPQFQFDDSGNIVGRFVYDEEGKPVLDEEGNVKVEKRSEMDMSKVGQAPGQASKRRGKRSTKEVFHQDLDVIKLRREEAHPWVLEAKNQTAENTALPEHWVGRMMEPSSLPTILLINEGEGASFTMVPLGRTYRFNPERPFKVMDADQANKYYELQTKYKIHDRWGQRQESAGPGFVKPEPSSHVEDRAQRMEWNIMANKGELKRQSAKREEYEDDYRREGRNIGRGLEGGIDEELDYDANDDFQDDEDSNTFYFNKEEEDEKKLQDDKQKQEFRWANANVGDRPQIEDDGDDDDDDLFGEKLTSAGKKLRRMMRKRGEEEGEMYDTSDDDDSDSDDDDDAKDKEKAKEAENNKYSRHGSRAGSRAPDGRGSSPARGLQPPTPERAGSLPGAGAALLAKRAASRGASPSLRAGSPLARGGSPDLGRGASPVPNGRSGSPSLTRGGSPAPGLEGTPSASGAAAAPRLKSKSAKRKATSESPLRDTPPSSSAPGSSNKRKSSEDVSASAAAHGPSTPRDSPANSDVERSTKKKKKSRASSGSATPTPFEGDSFPGMITSDDVLLWLRSQGGTIPMARAIQAFAKRIPAGDNTKKNQDLFLHWIRTFTDKVEGKELRLKAEFGE